MANSILFHELTKQLTGERWTIIRDHRIRQPMNCEYLSELVYGFGSCYVAHDVRFYPLGVGIHHDEKHLPHERASKIQM